jgi:plasmid stabilization system protein ParE
MELIALVRAEAEVLETQAQFEDVSQGLGDRFNARVEQGLDQLIEFPESGSRYTAPYRKLRVSGFPFGISYTIEGRRVIVQAVLDLRQDPQAIRRRLGPG